MRVMLVMRLCLRIGVLRVVLLMEMVLRMRLIRARGVSPAIRVP